MFSMLGCENLEEKYHSKAKWPIQEDIEGKPEVNEKFEKRFSDFYYHI